MGVSLFSSRIIIDALGVENYGIYTIVGGFISLFAVFLGSLDSAASRFFAFEIGKGQGANLKIVFRTSLFTHVFYAIVVALLLEVLGIYFLKNKLIIPHERIDAAIYIFHFSVVSIFISIVQKPLSALIIAEEKMKIYTYLGIFDVIVKLIIAVMLFYIISDKLILYGFLLMISGWITFLLHHFYCRMKISNSYSFKPMLNISLQKKMLVYIGWSFIGTISSVLRVQGINMLFNIFYGVVVNAAFGIAYQVYNIIAGFVNNFTIAINPQIIKRYASGDYDSMNKLIIKGAKYTYFLLLLIALPIIFNMDFLLNIWLVEVPPHASIFAKLLTVSLLVTIISNPIVTALYATGDIMMFQLAAGIPSLLILPISYLFIKTGYNPEIVYYIIIIFNIICNFIVIYILKLKTSQFVTKDFVLFSVFPSVLVTASSLFPSYIINKVFFESNWVSFFIVSIVCILSTILSIIFIGLNKQERKWFLRKIVAVIIRVVKV